MLQTIIDVAESVGIVAIVTNSKEQLETQLNRITRDEQDPIMLITWDITTNLNFDINGFLENPSSKIFSLLLSKPEDTTKDEAEKVAVEMGSLFQVFLQALYSTLAPLQRSSTPAPITEASYKLVPQHGAGKHSGVIGEWTMRTSVTNCTDG